ncbi:hypothetical protein SSCHL_0291 [Staphylococcus schleiferi]|nr:hypothetical protein SSCHL_0291 [Staphylococcus schleiferi]
MNNADDLTIDSGFYKPVVEPPKTDATYKVGDKVWNDTNKDGIQNANEAGIEGVKVTLTKTDGTTVETRTDKDGNYIFTDLPNGKYEISFETPEGYEATTANVGDDALDSDGTKVEVEVNNADDLTIDSGFYKPVVEPPKTDATYKVGDKVWNDTNKDGIQNPNEAGIEGVKVTLTKADGTTVETRTDKDGNYIFTGLPNGKYEISFETPEGYEATTANVGDDALDSDGTKVEVEVNNADDQQSIAASTNQHQKYQHRKYRNNQATQKYQRRKYQNNRVTQKYQHQKYRNNQVTQKHQHRKCQNNRVTQKYQHRKYRNNQATQKYQHRKYQNNRVTQKYQHQKYRNNQATQKHQHRICQNNQVSLK